MGSESLLGDWGVRRAASAGGFPATQAAGVTVQSGRTRRRKGGLCGRGRRFTDEVRAAVELRLKKGLDSRDHQWTRQVGGTCNGVQGVDLPAYLLRAKAGGDLWTCLPRAKQGGGGGRF